MTGYICICIILFSYYDDMISIDDDDDDALPTHIFSSNSIR